MVCLDQKAPLVCLVCLELKVVLASTVLQDCLECLEPKERVACLDSLAKEALMDIPEKKESAESLARAEETAFLERAVLLVYLASLE